MLVEDEPTMDNMIDGAMNDVVQTQDPANFVGVNVHLGDVQAQGAEAPDQFEDVQTTHYVFSDKFTEGPSH